MILSRKSRAPKCGFWLMRGAQPATSAGARLFAGSPIPAFLTTPKGDEEINLALAGFELAVLRALSGSPAIFSEKSTHCGLKYWQIHPFVARDDLPEIFLDSL
jgi:hypothetical protein